MSNNDAKKRVITYLILVFALSTIFYVLIPRQPEGIDSPLTLGLMWMPAVAALVTTFIYQRNLRGLGWGLGKPKYYLIAYLTPIIYASIAYLTIWALGLGGFKSDGWAGTVIQALTVGVLTAAIAAVA